MTSPAFGVFARVFPAGPAPQVATAIRDSGYTLAQLNLSALGLPTIPTDAEWPSIDLNEVAADFARAGVSIWGVSATYNMAHPDAAIRRVATMRAVRLIRASPALGATAITLCTGSRDPDRMWNAHPDNTSSAAWTDFRAELDLLLEAAIDADVLLGIEPEPGNVIRDADTAVRLLDELGTSADRIGIIFDAANLLQGVEPGGLRAVLEHSFEVLGGWIACLHAKDLVPWEMTIAGSGVVDYSAVASRWHQLPSRPPVIVQDARASEAAVVHDRLAAIFA